MCKIKFSLFLGIILSLTSCDQKYSLSPRDYLINIMGKEGENVTVTYTLAEDGEQRNYLHTESVTLPCTILADYRDPSKNSLKTVSISLTNTTSDSLTVLITDMSQRFNVKGNWCNVYSIIEYWNESSKYEYPTYEKEITMDSLRYVLKRLNYEGIKVLYPHENGRIELLNKEGRIN